VGLTRVIREQMLMQILVEMHNYEELGGKTWEFYFKSIWNYFWTIM